MARATKDHRMKLTKLAHLLVIASVLSLAAVGCKKNPTPLTPLRGAQYGSPGGPDKGEALDSGMPRLSGNTLMRPWLQAFSYNDSQILAEIDEAEQRGTGWLLWNVGGEYAASSLPTAGN